MPDNLADRTDMSERKPVCPRCGREAVVVQGRVVAGHLVREWACAKCKNTWPVERELASRVV